ncbi:MAG: acyl carrier protein [Aquabacterium sp.]
MNAKTAYALSLVQQALAKYTDVPVSDIHLDTALADLQVDSLTLAELLFELEDQMGTSIADTAGVPRTIADVIALVEPFIKDEDVKSAA